MADPHHATLTLHVQLQIRESASTPKIILVVTYNSIIMLVTQDGKMWLLIVSWHGPDHILAMTDPCPTSLAWTPGGRACAHQGSGSGWGAAQWHYRWWLLQATGEEYDQVLDFCGFVICYRIWDHVGVVKYVHVIFFFLRFYYIWLTFVGENRKYSK